MYIYCIVSGRLRIQDQIYKINGTQNHVTLTWTGASPTRVLLSHLSDGQKVLEAKQSPVPDLPLLLGQELQ